MRLFASVVVCLLLSAVALDTGAVGITVSDACGKTHNVSTGNSVVVNASGDISATGAAASGFSAAVGNCIPSGAPQRCELYVSATNVTENSQVTLQANCSQGQTQLAWVNPQGGPDATTTNGVATLTFPAAGAYSYAIAATYGATTVRSKPVTVVVTKPGSKPNCVVSASPMTILAGASAKLISSCEPEATTYTWTSNDAGAPAIAAGNPTPTVAFPAAGTFTYKLQPGNASGNGAVSSATVNVVSSSCPAYSGPVIDPTPIGYSYYGAAFPVNAPYAFKYTPGANASGSFNFENIANPAVTQWEMKISACPGDFSPGACHALHSPSVGALKANLYSTISPPPNASYCGVTAAVPLYMNFRVLSCANGATQCALRVTHTN